MGNILRRYLLPLVFLLAGLVLGYLIWGGQKEKIRENVKFTEQREGGYMFINPLLECDIAQEFVSSREILPFKESIEAFINGAREKGTAKDISVYFRKLNNGRWFAVGETDKFIPASLLKVPLMIAAFKVAEKNPGFLTRKIRYRRTVDHNAYQGIKPRESLINGMEYTIDELIYRMIAYSDNNAYYILAGTIISTFQTNVFTDLGVKNEITRGDYMPAPSYASFLRILYNASYLNRDFSEKALKYLSETDFNYGLVAGLPKDIQVSHKFGEAFESKLNLVELHDCGIVYHPSSPYLICIMTKGNDFKSLANNIAEISRISYLEVDRQVKSIK